MATIVHGLGTSHSPQLSTDEKLWHLHAARDRDNPRLLGLDARFHTFAQLAAGGAVVPESELTEQAWRAKYDRAQAALAELSRRLRATQPDVVLVVGDDQDELFDDTAVPTFGLYVGDTLWDRPPSREAALALPPGLAEAQWAQHAAAPDSYEMPVPLVDHLARQLGDAGFDLCVSRRQAPGRVLGHAFTFVRLRLDLPRRVPIVPVFVNTYFPPNVPSVPRCYRFGAALRAAVAAWPGSERVALVASGGLSHFVVDEKLDRGLLAAMAADDVVAMAEVTKGKMLSGTSEALNWVVVAGAMAGAPMSVIDYVPAYRTTAGTGVGMAFAAWQPASS